MASHVTLPNIVNGETFGLFHYPVAKYKKNEGGHF